MPGHPNSAGSTSPERPSITRSKARTFAGASRLTSTVSAPARFSPRRGPAAVVVQHYQRDAEVPDTPRGRFLREVENRLRSLEGVAHVIGPRHNDAHRDHFHIDRAWRWWRFGDEG